MKCKGSAKVRILAVAKMLSEGKRLSVAAIIRRLDLEYDIQVDRKTLISDIYAINRFFPDDVAYGQKGGYMKHNVLEALEDGQ